MGQWKRISPRALSCRGQTFATRLCSLSHPSRYTLGQESHPQGSQGPKPEMPDRSRVEGIKDQETCRPLTPLPSTQSRSCSSARPWTRASCFRQSLHRCIPVTAFVADPTPLLEGKKRCRVTLGPLGLLRNRCSVCGGMCTPRQARTLTARKLAHGAVDLEDQPVGGVDDGQ